MGTWVDGIPVAPRDMHDDRSEWNVRRGALTADLLAAAEALLAHSGACEISIDRPGIAVVLKLIPTQGAHKDS